VIFDEKLSPTERLLFGALVVAMAAGGFWTGRVAFNPHRATAQPIQFNHLKHVKGAGMECSVCHEYFAEHQHSGLPDLSACTTCHQQPLTKSTEEQKLITLAASASPPSFKKLFRLPDHVYYSHRRHVTVAKLQCPTCHGAIADTEAPPPRPLVTITMKTCTDCHTRQSVQTDCTACHR
jgi:hypothetical protein